MRYTIIANPASGKLSVEKKQALLREAACVLDAEIHGLGTLSREDFRRCARALAPLTDVLVVAGGDGTFSDIINALDAIRTAIGYLPLGTGNALKHALDYKGSFTNMARCIRDGQIHEYDLIDCGGKRRGFMASIGIDGAVIRLRDDYLAQGMMGFKAYFRAVVRAFLSGDHVARARVTIDNRSFEMERLLSLMVVKQPYFGFGMKVVPGARFDDGQLHILCLPGGLFRSMAAFLTAFSIGNRVGRYTTGRELQVHLDRPMALQIDGSLAWEADTFRFRVLPRALRIKYQCSLPPLYRPTGKVQKLS
jgi:diacylglycerol kinase family enzyme